MVIDGFQCLGMISIVAIKKGGVSTRTLGCTAAGLSFRGIRWFLLQVIECVCMCTYANVYRVRACLCYVWARWSSSSPCFPMWYLAKSFLVTSPTTCRKRGHLRPTIINYHSLIEVLNKRKMTRKLVTLFWSSATTRCLSPSALNSLNTRGREVSYKKVKYFNVSADVDKYVQMSSWGSLNIRSGFAMQIIRFFC